MIILNDEKRKNKPKPLPINVSVEGKSSAAVYKHLNADVGSFVRFSSNRNNIKLISIVRGKHIGEGRVSKINLEFVDMPFRIELIE